MRIPLSQGKFAVVDPADALKISSFSWSAHKWRRNWYAKARVNARLTSLHSFLLGRPEKDIDHRNGDGLDCRRENLRLATPSENGANARKKESPSTSSYKGVSWNQNAFQWRAYYAPNREQVHLGYFDSEIEAAKAYDAAAKKHWGEFAKLNFSE